MTFAAESGDPKAQIDAAPIEYVEMIVLPRQGIEYCKTKKMSLIERHLLFFMLAIEARPEFIPKVKPWQA